MSCNVEIRKTPSFLKKKAKATFNYLGHDKKDEKI